MFFSNTVTSIIGAVGNKIIIQCAADKTPQDGVYLYKQVGASKHNQEVFYYYKDGYFSPKSKWCRDKFKVNGTFTNFNVTVLNVSATDNGFYWCEFNLEDKNTVGTVTWLWIGKCVLHIMQIILSYTLFRQSTLDISHFVTKVTY